MRICLWVVVLAVSSGLACGSEDAACTDDACAASCRSYGSATGSCVGGACRCSGVPDGGTDGGTDDGTVRDDGSGGGDDGAADRADAGHWCAESSYIWIANTAEGTLSKLCTLDGVEVGRYVTSPQGATGDPSRTSVNLHGDMVVTNRNTTGGPSSVTKFAAERPDCVDRNGDLEIRTSTGGTDVLAWGEDECMIWNMPLNGGSSGIGARATAWDGTEDPATGEGGHVWIGALGTGQVFKLDGDTGEIVGETHVANQPYGGAMDGRGNFWVVGAFCTIGLCNLARVNTDTFEVTTFPVPCGYGISVDARDRIWTSGRTMTGSCVTRLDQDTGESVTHTAAGMMNFYRGIAVDNVGSVWVANTSGSVVQVAEADVSLVHEVAGVAPESVVGVAIDFQHNVWAISEGGNLAAKIHPTTYAVEHFPVGRGPYTYSDMTGFQLRTVIY